jgi:hypothetical protein
VRAPFPPFCTCAEDSPARVWSSNNSAAPAAPQCACRCGRTGNPGAILTHLVRRAGSADGSP